MAWPDCLPCAHDLLQPLLVRREEVHQQMRCSIRFRLPLAPDCVEERQRLGSIEVPLGLCVFVRDRGQVVVKRVASAVGGVVVVLLNLRACRRKRS